MKKTVLFCLGFALLLLFNSCSSIKVVSDVDKTADWSSYKTFQYYGWAEESDKILTRFDRERIENAFADEFSKRGLKLVEEEGDLLVVLFVVIEQKTQKTATTTHMGGGGYYGDYYGYGPGFGWGAGHMGGMSTTNYHEYDYDVGTLVIDVIDLKVEQLVWESIGSGTVDDNPETRDENLPKAIAKIMEPFPIAPMQ